MSFINYMLEEVTEEYLQLGNTVCDDEKTVTDQSGMSNKAKWDKALGIFMANEKATLFSQIDYESIYRDDQARNCEGASYVADLRAQFFDKLLKKAPGNAQYHALYVQNRVWHVRFRERAFMDLFSEVAKKMPVKPY